jgi:hypothetical protein
MKRNKIISIFFFSIFFSSILFTACNNGNNDKSKSKDTTAIDSSKLKPKFVLPKGDRKYDDLARLMAGLKAEEGSQFAALQEIPKLKTHEHSFDTLWSKSEVIKYSDKMKDWRKAELGDDKNDTTSLFYPFSGPDFLNAFTFFPYAKKYIMLALEPAGTIPDFSKVPADTFSGYFNMLKNSLNSILNLSFFQTIAMSHDFKNQVINGTIPVLFTFIVRTGNKINDVKPVMIDSTGAIVPAEFVSVVKNISKNYGVQIDFKNPDNDYLQTVYYFSCDLSNDGFNKDKGLKTYLNSLGAVKSYLKAASCLMFHDFFSQIRDVMITHTDLLLEDDSGIPYKYFDKKIWDIKLYGDYVRPIPLFADDYQKDLRQAYINDSASIKKLDFGIGYNYVKGKSNMMVAKKKANK